MRIFFSIIALFTSLSLTAQPTADLVAYYDFDNDDGSIIDQTGNISNNGISDITAYDCGVEENSIRFDGVDDIITIEGTEAIQAFGTEDLTISFYFKAFNSSTIATQTIMSKRADCGNTNAFAVRYSPSSRFLNVIFTENLGVSGSVSAELNPDRCWYHVVILREAKEVRLYVDGFLLATSNAPERVDISSDALPLLIGAPSCSTTDAYFEGLLDELRIYTRALGDAERETLNLRPDQIGNGFINVNLPKDTTIFLGNTVQAFITNTCASDFLWYPDIDITNTLIPEPVFSPTEPTTYYLEFSDFFGCTATDSLQINVIDPAELECSAFLPNAFSPNDDGLNDLYGVDNPFSLTDFIALEIFDRWGNRVFFTDDPFIKWNGFYRSSAVNPGIYIYKVEYRCEGIAQSQAGTFTIIR